MCIRDRSRGSSSDVVLSIAVQRSLMLSCPSLSRGSSSDVVLSIAVQRSLMLSCPSLSRGSSSDVVLSIAVQRSLMLSCPSLSRCFIVHHFPEEVALMFSCLSLSRGPEEVALMVLSASFHCNCSSFICACIRSRHAGNSSRPAFGQLLLNSNFLPSWKKLVLIHWFVCPQTADGASHWWCGPYLRDAKQLVRSTLTWWETRALLVLVELSRWSRLCILVPENLAGKLWKHFVLGFVDRESVYV